MTSVNRRYRDSLQYLPYQKRPNFTDLSNLGCGTNVSVHDFTSFDAVLSLQA